MAKDIKNLIIPFAVILCFGGIPALHATIEGLKELFVVSLPIFTDIVKQEIENYLTSPYFITGIILNVFALFGIWLGKEKSKIVYGIISIALAITNALPIIRILFEN